MGNVDIPAEILAIMRVESYYVRRMKGAKSLTAKTHWFARAHEQRAKIDNMYWATSPIELVKTGDLCK